MAKTTNRNKAVLEVRALLADSDRPWETIRGILEAVNEHVEACIEDDIVDASEGMTPQELRDLEEKLDVAEHIVAMMLSRVRGR